jgi:hypothetical protein
MDQRRERIEDARAHVAPPEPDRVGDRIAVDRGARDRRVDQPDVHVGQAGLPRDRPFRLAKRLALDALDQLLELGIGDRLVRMTALLRDAGGEALDQLAGDPDHDLVGMQLGHALGLVERLAAVGHHRGDVGDRPRLHV